MKRRITLILAIVFIVILAACNGGDDAGNKKDTNSNSDKDTKIVVIAKSNNSEFWQTVKFGAEEAGEEEGIEVTFQARPSETDIEGQVRIVEDSINQGVDAIVLAPSDVDALASV